MLLEEAARSGRLRLSVTRPKRTSSLAGISDVTVPTSLTGGFGDVTAGHGDVEQATAHSSAAQYSVNTGLDYTVGLILIQILCFLCTLTMQVVKASLEAAFDHDFSFF